MINVRCNICEKTLKGFNFSDKYTKIVITRHTFLKNAAQDQYYLCDHCAKRLIKNLKGSSVDLLLEYKEESKTPNEMREEKGLERVEENSDAKH